MGMRRQDEGRRGEGNAGAKQCCQKVVVGVDPIHPRSRYREGKGGGEGAKGARLTAKGSEGQCEGRGQTARQCVGVFWWGRRVGMAG